MREDVLPGRPFFAVENSERFRGIECPEVRSVMIHVVTGGETVYSIARQYGVDPVRLAADNGVPQTGRLAVGQTLAVQFPREVYEVQPGDTLTTLAGRYG